MYVYANQVVAHMMPDLPNVGLERDIEQFIVRNYVHMYAIIDTLIIYRNSLRIQCSELMG